MLSKTPPMGFNTWNTFGENINEQLIKETAAIDELKSRGVWIFGADMDGTDYTALDYSGSIALVIGSEGKGIGRLVREKCDFIASLPMRGKINSLNASVAAGILMFEAAKHRN